MAPRLHSLHLRPTCRFLESPQNSKPTQLRNICTHVDPFGKKSVNAKSRKITLQINLCVLHFNY